MGHFEANDSGTTRGKTDREHMHRCPVCERMKKAVRINVEKIAEQVRRMKQMPNLSEAQIDALTFPFWFPIIGITDTLNCTNIRALQSLSDVEADAYIQKYLTHEKWHPTVFAGPDGQRLRPTLTLLQGGKRDGNE